MHEMPIGGNLDPYTRKEEIAKNVF